MVRMLIVFSGVEAILPAEMRAFVLPHEALSKYGRNHPIRRSGGLARKEQGMDWTDERMELLKNLWKDGLSASQIAKQLGGVSRSAVIGKVHRLGLEGRVTPSIPALLAYKAPRPKRELSESAKPRSVQEPQEATNKKSIPAPVRYLDETPGNATIQTLGDHMCKWPIGDPAVESFTFCGRRKINGPYCDEHALVAHQPAKAKKRAGGANELARSLRRYI